MLEIKKDIFYVGAINPALRVFDIIMKTEYGTSYNAYLIKDEKNVLVETVHERFCDEYIENIEALIRIQDIDYLILNHTEPDHTGSVRKLLEINPNITVITTMAGKRFVSEILNHEFQSIIIKEDQNLKIGKRTLQFLIAPLLHWPDSMFTYIESDKILFSCDFLGTHYAEPKVLDKYIKYMDKYQEAMQNYFNAIFGPFKPNVLYGLSKIEDLKIDTVCTSHGPILQNQISYVIEQYRKWSTPVQRKNKKVTIFYVSAYGYTKKLAILAKEQLENKGLTVELFNAIECQEQDIMNSIENSNGILIGSPTINRDALKPIWNILTSLDAISNKDKVFGLFGSYGWTGEAVPMMKQRLESLRLHVFKDGIKVCFNPSNQSLEEMKNYVNEFADTI